MPTEFPTDALLEPGLSPAVRPVLKASSVKPGYRTYALILMTSVFTVTFLDRQILAVLLPQIKGEFALNDTEIGLLTGPAFGLIYSVVSIPLSTLSDRFSRRNIIAGCVLVFSLMTMLCGYCSTFAQLCIVRFGVGIGEAGSIPAGSSMLTDLYPREKRASAMSVYGSGLNIGVLLGFFGGGLVAQYYGWRNAFIVAGVSGLFLVLLLITTMREPVRGQSDGHRVQEQPVRFSQALRHLLSQPTYVWMLAGGSLATWVLMAIFTFSPLFLAQSHGLQPGMVGLILAILNGVFGALGTYGAGLIADRLGKRALSRTMLVPMAALAGAAPFLPIFFLSASLPIALLAAIIPAVLCSGYLGPSYALVQTIAPANMRAQASAILVTVVNLFGLCFGPPIVGLVSDILRPELGRDSLRVALMLSVPATILAAMCYWRIYQILRKAEVGGAGKD